MSEYRRPRIPGATVFFTVCLAHRGSDLLVAEVVRLREAVASVRAARPFAIDAFVVLPDHLHAVWTLPEGDHDFSTRWKDIKAAFSKSVGLKRSRSMSKVAKGEAGLWQRRFWDHHIRNASDLKTHLHYCWGNPVRHGLVSRPTDWPHSSIHRDVRLGRVEAGWYERIAEGHFGE